MISILGFENSPCKRDNSDVHRRDTGPSTACCRLAVSPFEKKTTISRSPTISALSATTQWLNTPHLINLLRTFSPAIHPQFTKYEISSEVAGARRDCIPRSSTGCHFLTSPTIFSYFTLAISSRT